MGNNSPTIPPGILTQAPHPAIQFPCPNCGTVVSVPIPLGTIVNHPEFAVALWKISETSRCPKCLAGYKPILQILQQAGWGATSVPDEPGKIITLVGMRVNKPS